MINFHCDENEKKHMKKRDDHNVGTRILATQHWISCDPCEQWGGDTIQIQNHQRKSKNILSLISRHGSSKIVPEIKVT